MRKLLLVLTVVVAGAAGASALRAQAPASAAATFEVASVKPSNPDTSNPMNLVPGILPVSGGRLTLANIPLRVLVLLAYDVQDFQIAGGPSWQLTNKFDIHAKAEDGFTGGVPEMRPMVRALLADRFKLKVHNETREMPISALVIARSDGRLGPDMKPSKSDCSHAEEMNRDRAEALRRGDTAELMRAMQSGQPIPCMMIPRMATGPAGAANARSFVMHGDGQAISVLTSLLTQATGRMVQDRTGLTGLYDWDLDFDPQVLMRAVSQMGINLPTGANMPQSDSPALLTAIQEQLGLRLVNERGPVQVLVIDSAELPTPD